MKLHIRQLMILFFFLSACHSYKEKSKENKALEYPVIRVLAKDTVLNSEYVTEIHAIRNVEIRARVSGFLDKIFVDEGQKVKKGQLLFKINDEEYRALSAKANALLNSAIAETKSAELEVTRLKVLVEKKVISNTELEVANAKLIAAKSKIDEAQSVLSNANIRLSYTHIKAPFDGVLDRIPLKVGSLISEGTLLSTISDVSEIYCYFNVSEREYLKYRKSKSGFKGTLNCMLQLADGALYAENGVIETVGGEIDNETGSIVFRARFPNSDRLLTHGASGKIIIKNKIKDALLIPQRCAFEIQDKNYVFIIDSSNTLKMKSFIPKARLDDFYVVSSGLSLGNRILYEGIQNIQEGVKIIPAEISMDSLLRQ